MTRTLRSSRFFNEFLYYYGSVRLPFLNRFYRLSLKMDIPCSVIKPIYCSCHLYNGGNIASKQVAAILIPTSFARCGFSLLLMRFRYFFSDSLSFISSKCTWWLPTFSLSVHYSSFATFAAQGGLVIPPIQHNRYFVLVSTPNIVSSLLQHFKEHRLL